MEIVKEELQLQDPKDADVKFGFFDAGDLEDVSVQERQRVATLLRRKQSTAWQELEKLPWDTREELAAQVAAEGAAPTEPRESIQQLCMPASEPPPAMPTSVATSVPASVMPTSVPESQRICVPTTQPPSVSTSQLSSAPPSVPSSVPTSIPTTLPTSLPPPVPTSEPVHPPVPQEMPAQMVRPGMMLNTVPPMAGLMCGVTGMPVYFMPQQMPMNYYGGPPPLTQSLTMPLRQPAMVGMASPAGPAESCIPTMSMSAVTQMGIHQAHAGMVASMHYNQSQPGMLTQTSPSDMEVVGGRGVASPSAPPGLSMAKPPSDVHVITGADNAVDSPPVSIAAVPQAAPYHIPPHDSYDDTNNTNNSSKETTPQPEVDQSKLQKTYERRNKKRRPANYYEKRGGDGREGQSEEQSNIQGGFTDCESSSASLDMDNSDVAIDKMSYEAELVCQTSDCGDAGVTLDNQCDTAVAWSDDGAITFVASDEVPAVPGPSVETALPVQKPQYDSDKNQPTSTEQQTSLSLGDCTENTVSKSIEAQNTEEVGQVEVDSSTNVHYNSPAVEHAQTPCSPLPAEETPTEPEVPQTEDISRGEIAAPAPAGAYQQPAKTKPSSWAQLFRGEKSAESATVIYSPSQATQQSTSQQPPPAPVTDVHSNNKDKPGRSAPSQQESDVSTRRLGNKLAELRLDHKPVSVLPRGLANQANWCYINATLQALLACTPLYRLLKGLPQPPKDSKVASSTPVTDSLVQFVNEFTPGQVKPDKKSLNNKGTLFQDMLSGSSFEPTYVYKMLKLLKYDMAFKHGKQEDAEEFLSCVLNGMHEEMVAAIKLSTGDNSKTCLASEEYVNTNGACSPGSATEESDTADDEGWEQVGPKNRSIITRTTNFTTSPISSIFQGQLRSILHKSGVKESATLQPFFTLQLDIQAEKVRTLRDAIEGFVSRESLHGYTCGKTKQQVEASRRMMLEELPHVLVLHLKCFVYDKSGGCQKVTKVIDFSTDLEILKDYLSPNVRNKYSNTQRKYQLFAVVSHHGPRAIGGHYTTDFFHPGLNGWVHADDLMIRSITLTQLFKFISPRVPYLLYYRRMDVS